jgi:hypothetical protein
MHTTAGHPIVVTSISLFITSPGGSQQGEEGHPLFKSCALCRSMPRALAGHAPSAVAATVPFPPSSPPVQVAW